MVIVNKIGGLLIITMTSAIASYRKPNTLTMPNLVKLIYGVISAFGSVHELTVFNFESLRVTQASSAFTLAMLVTAHLSQVKHGFQVRHRRGGRHKITGHWAGRRVYEK